jgi:hypothetical protein
VFLQVTARGAGGCERWSADQQPQPVVRVVVVRRVKEQKQWENRTIALPNRAMSLRTSSPFFDGKHE